MAAGGENRRTAAETGQEREHAVIRCSMLSGLFRRLGMALLAFLFALVLWAMFVTQHVYETLFLLTLAFCLAVHLMFLRARPLKDIVLWMRVSPEEILFKFPFREERYGFAEYGLRLVEISRFRKRCRIQIFGLKGTFSRHCRIDLASTDALSRALRRYGVPFTRSDPGK